MWLYFKIDLVNLKHTLSLLSIFVIKKRNSGEKRYIYSLQGLSYLVSMSHDRVFYVESLFLVSFLITVILKLIEYHDLMILTPERK
jgi:hypothetical protein